MSDLRTRFRSLDDLRTPDLWSEIEARATADRPFGVGGLRWALIAALLLLILALAGAAMLGSGVVRWPLAVETSPRPSMNPQSSLAQNRTDLVVWQPPGGNGLTGGGTGVSYAVFVAVRNTSNGWVHVDTFKSSYSILSRGGPQMDRGALGAVPETIGPGQVGYLVGGNTYQTMKGITPADFAGATVSVHIVSSAVATPTATVVISGIGWTKGGTGLFATGVATADGAAVPYVVVNVLCIGKDGKVLGEAVGPLHDLLPGKPKTFETEYATARLKAGQCASAFGAAQPENFDMGNHGGL
jgi:hypothetical protein